MSALLHKHAVAARTPAELNKRGSARHNFRPHRRQQGRLQLSSKAFLEAVPRWQIHSYDGVGRTLTSDVNAATDHTTQPVVCGCGT